MRTITFYSYKGGVGRTLVVANIARYLARFGQKVFVLDFDLEAPGLHYKLGLNGRIERGLVDYVDFFLATGREPPSLQDFVIDLPPSPGEEGSIHIMAAGAAPAVSYWQKLARINWHELFYREDAIGIPFFLELKARIAEEIRPDYLLIDSRTGITEMGGVATAILPDQVVGLVVNNQESLEGLREVLRSIRRAPRLPGLERIEVLPVLTRLPELDEPGAETEIVERVRTFLNEESPDLAASLAVPEVLVLHSDPDLQVREALRIGNASGPGGSALLRDYLHLFSRIVPEEVLRRAPEPAILPTALRTAQDHPVAVNPLARWSANPLFAFGVDGMTGDFAFKPSTAEELADYIRGQAAPPDIEDLERWRLSTRRRLRRGDRGNLAEAGWGVIFAQEEPQEGELRKALQPLLDLRRAQAGLLNSHYYREFRGAKGYRPGDTKASFLERHGVGPGPGDPNYVPFYLLIIGDPETIPFSFQSELDIQYGVGRLCFDTVGEYANYVRTVVESETLPLQRPRQAAFFAPHHPYDPCTELSSRWLARPLAAYVESHCPSWTVQSLVGPEASKSKLQNLLGGKETPSFLFTASHGLVYPREAEVRQRDFQGALLCDDWPGPEAPPGSLRGDQIFSSRDLTDEAQLAGLICFHYACYSAGTPSARDFQSRLKEPMRTATKPFVASLAQRLLGHPKGGALAVIGQIESTWTSSILWDELKEPQFQVFEDAVTSLLNGEPVGVAMEVFAERYAELSASLSRELQLIRIGEREKDGNYLANVWTSCSDARNYIVLGDPAVRLAVAPPD
ncbi:MAG TPA: AAA family ATPase [Thermoanaerobaculia bacterium]|nr:AAA family ATPase [Thermoanaerobaculia bacterium]